MAEENKFKLEKKIWGGLLPTPIEKQKYSFGACFGYIDPKTLPITYQVGEPIEIKNQNIPSPTWICVAESLCAVSEYQEGTALEPAFTCKVISELTGSTSWTLGGTSLEIGAKASLRGFLTRQDSPYSVEKDGVGIVASPDKWNKTYDDLAMIHAKQNWFWIGVSKGSMFDKIRSAMYQFKDEKRAVQTGVMWHNEWTDKTFIDEEGTPAGGHAIAIIGWNQDYLTIQNSIGNVGKNGLQFIHKDLVNKLFTFGALTFSDLPKELSHQDILDKSKYYRANLFGKFLILLQRYFGEIFRIW